MCTYLLLTLAYLQVINLKFKMSTSKHQEELTIKNYIQRLHHLFYKVGYTYPWPVPLKMGMGIGCYILKCNSSTSTHKCARRLGHTYGVRILFFFISTPSP